MQRHRFINPPRGSTLGRRPDIDDFANPYSWESNDEARVQLELESRHVPFAYRWFPDKPPTLKMLIPDYHPEFTLQEYKIVISILGGFFGQLPGVIDRVALAGAALEHDGWKQIVWQSNEIKTQGVHALMERDLPELRRPTITGAERVSPYGHPLTMETRRKFLRGLALLKKLFTPKTVEAANGSGTRTRRKFLHPERSDSGRYRPLSRRYDEGNESER